MTDHPSKTIIELITAVKERVGAVAKSDRNTQHNFNFRGIDAVVNAVSGAFIEYGVVTIPEITDYQYGTIEVGKDRTRMGHVRVTVAYHFHGPAGDEVTAIAPGEAFDVGDKATPKAMSVAYRTALLQTLTLPTDETDPDAHSYERSGGPVEPQTDHEWLSRTEAAIAAAESSEDLDKIRQDARAVHQAGKLEKVHSDHLLHLFQQRAGQLAKAGEAS